MSRSLKFLVVAGVTLVFTAGGYRLGAGAWPSMAKLRGSISSQTGSAGMIEPASASPQPPNVDRRILYWKHPAGVPNYAPMAAKAPDGRDYLPVYEDQEALLPGEPKPEPPKAVTSGPKKLLYYRNPMGLADTSPVPKKDWMGMDYIAVYDGEEETGSIVKVSLDKLQRSGVRTTPAEMRALVRPVRAPGVAKPDERTLYTVALRADSFIEKLYVNETGRHVKKGEPLFRVYSADMVKVQVDYRISANSAGGRAEKGAEQRLRNLQIPNAVIDQLRRTREPVLSIDWPSPANGVVMQKKAVEGMMMKAGEEMMRLVDPSSIWIITDVAEQDIGQVRVGAPARVKFRAYPSEVFKGEVTFILQELEMTTRTAKVRIEIKNPNGRIKYEMFADVEIDAGDGERERLLVPVSALIDSGRRQVVIVDLGKGRFDPRPVKVGMRGDGFVEILEGIKAGEPVVVAANFLIDAESNLKAALAGFTAEPVGSDDPAASAKSEIKP